MKHLRVKVILYKDRLVRSGQKTILGLTLMISEKHMMNIDVMELYGKTLFRNLCRMIEHENN